MNEIQAIQALSPLDGRYQSKVKNLQQFFSEMALIKNRVKVEIEWLIALSLNPQIDTIQPLSETDQEKLRTIYIEFTPENALEVKEIEKTTNHDVKAVEYFINNQLKKEGLEDYIVMVHFACTSEDINNLSHGLMISDALNFELIPEWELLISKIDEKAKAYRSIPMLSRTHGQSASPTTMGKELANVVARLKRQLKQIKNQQVLGKLNGAVGNFNAHVVSFPEVDWKSFSRQFIESLGLVWNQWSTQIEPHDYMAEIFQNFIRFNTILLDFDRDIWGYISNNVFTQKRIEGQVGSSTMPHKINPIDFENSEGNLGLANALFDHMAMKLPVSRWQRDLTDSTVIRNIGVAFGYSSLAYTSTMRGLGKLEINEAAVKEELAAHTEVLAEAVQTVMRRYRIPNAYEKLKKLTQGKEITTESMKSFVESLDLPENVRSQLAELSPLDYIGLAEEL